MFISYFWSHWDEGDEYLHQLNWRNDTWSRCNLICKIKRWLQDSWWMAASIIQSCYFACCVCVSMKKGGNGFIHVSSSLVRCALGARLPCTDEVALGLDNAPALNNDGVAQHPLQPPVCDVQVLRSLLHRLLECGCWHQLCGNMTPKEEPFKNSGTSDLTLWKETRDSLIPQLTLTKKLQE